MNRLASGVAILALAVIPAAAPAAVSDWIGAPPPGAAYPEGEEARQWAILSHDLAQRGRSKTFAGTAYRPEALILEADRDPLDVMLRRTQALLDDLRAMPKARDLDKEAADLAALQERAKDTDPAKADDRRALFNEACRLRRRIAFANPLLDFGGIVFIKRNLNIFNHMCDQFYGMAQRPGGGLFAVEDAFGSQPRVRDILADSTVQNGRLAGRALSGGPRRDWNTTYDGMGNLHGEETQGGSFLSPDLSFDGRTLAFAYVECEGDRRHVTTNVNTRGHWPEGRSYHVFTVGADGSDLRMLTDGTWNDFDPCFTPAGRIAFTSERRGGYLRCGRICPNYTLHDMAADGSGIRCLSFHETNEWNPSVTEDGMIVWTRWDYVDRHGCTAHKPWVTTPDGRNPRPLHGNYSIRRQRPDMEVDVRGIPGSPHMIATAAPHHGLSFGSLVLIDPNAHDDDAMGPVRRLTPDVGFPESQGGSLTYGTPWPLSDRYWLCAYEPAEVKGLSPDRSYGLYLVDAFGNRELIYRDPGIACMSPIPLKPRRTPPVVPELSEPPAPGQPAEASVGVVDVYHSLKPWPEGTKIKALRVYQIFPLPMGTAQTPFGTGIQLPQGRDSINVARAALGTAPVESDGSAHFIVPAQRELYFQALDENGLAVTSMRSSTQFMPGEKATCMGCHEPKLGAALAPGGVTPLAMRRPPSRLEPEPDGSNPFSYPRLVQPVLNKHCLECHAKNPDKAPRMDTEMVVYNGPGRYGDGKYFASYVSLAPNFGFTDYGGKGFDDPKFYRTTPGEFGARASKLYHMLKAGHHDVKLTPEEMRRLIVWLDSCSLFYGVYEKDAGEAQRRGEIARPWLE